MIENQMIKRIFKLTTNRKVAKQHHSHSKEEHLTTHENKTVVTKGYPSIKTLKEIIARSDELMIREQLYLESDLSISYLALAIGTNRSYMSLAIKEIKECTFTFYINKMRIEHAKELIAFKTSANYREKNGEPLSLEELSTASGFASLRSFARHFKLIVGTTPARYIKAIHSGAR